MTACNDGKPHGFLHVFHELSPDHRLLRVVGPWIGSGKFADVHHLSQERVLRISVCSEFEWDMERKPTLRNLKRNPHQCVVRVHRYGVIGKVTHASDPDANWVYYYTIMERLQPITDEAEGEAICTVFDAAIRKVPEEGTDSTAILRYHLSKVRRGMKNFRYDHSDIHWGNIMRDRDGNYKLIDLDSLY